MKLKYERPEVFSFSKTLIMPPIARIRSWCRIQVGNIKKAYILNIIKAQHVTKAMP